MPSYVPAKKNTQFIYYMALVSQADTKLLKSNPTIASGDFKASLDGGSLANLGTLPTVTPASSVMVKVTLATSEMNGDNATVVSIDAAGAEWCDRVDNFQTAARQIEDLAYPATSGRSMVVDANGLVDANTVKLGPTGAGTAQTARDVGASVLLSPGTGTGQLDITSGVTKSNLTQILATTLTETAGQLAGGFKKFFNIATPAATMDHLILVDTATVATTATSVTNDVGITQAAADKAWGTTVRALTDKVGFALTAAYDPAKTASQAGDIMKVSSGTGANQISLSSGLVALQAGSSGGIQAIWDQATSTNTTAGSVGKAFNDLVTRIGTPAGATIAADIAAVLAAIPSANANADALLDRANGIESGFTLRQSTRIILAGVAGKSSGLDTGAPVFRSIGDTKDRITATVSSGNRTAVTVDGT